MESIYSPNYQALEQFSRSVTLDLAPRNRHVKMATCSITYVWHNQQRSTITNIIINLDDHPYATMQIIDSDWLNAHDFYTRFCTGYNIFSFDQFAKTLKIVNNAPSKLPGNYYQVEIVEV